MGSGNKSVLSTYGYTALTYYTTPIGNGLSIGYMRPIGNMFVIFSTYNGFPQAKALPQIITSW